MTVSNKASPTLEAPYRGAGEPSQNSIELDPDLFGRRVNRRLMSIILTAYASAKHLGTVSTKTRGEVRGGGKKPWKQKGTGNARHGSIRSPLWRGGAVVFGPRPRSYAQRLPKALRAQALASALSLKAREKKILIIDKFALGAPKTRAFLQALEALGVGCEKRMLLVVVEQHEALRLASSNVRERCRVETARNLTADAVLRRQLVLIEKDAIPVLKERI